MIPQSTTLILPPPFLLGRHTVLIESQVESSLCYDKLFGVCMTQVHDNI